MLVDTIHLNMRISSKRFSMAKQKFDPEKIRTMYAEQGLSTVEIARLEGATPGGIKAILHRLGVPRRGCGGRRTEKVFGFTPTKEFMSAAMAHFNNVAADAARHYNVKYATWIDWLERFGISRAAPGTVLKGRPSHRRHELPVEEAVALSDGGMTYTEIASKFGVSYGVVIRRMQEIGYEAPWRRTADERFKTISFHKRKILLELNITACEICGETRALDFAHIQPAKDGGPVSKDNCLVLCQTHHHCYDNGTLTEEEFYKISDKVRRAEATYSWVNGFYGGW